MTDTMTQDAPSRQPATVGLGDWVRVHNIGTDEVTIQWDSRKYVIPVNEEMFVPFEAAKLWFGDPRATENVRSHRDVQGIVSWIPDRETEVRRLRALYDNQFGDETKITNHPEVEVFTQTGDRIYTVLDDAQGERVIAAATSQWDENQYREQIVKQQRMIEVLMERTSSLEQSLRQRDSDPGPQPAEAPEPVVASPTTIPSPMMDDNA